MHIDEKILAEVMKITGSAGKTKAVETALKETVRKARLKQVLGKGSGVPAARLAGAYDPASLAVYRVAEDQKQARDATRPENHEGTETPRFRLPG